MVIAIQSRREVPEYRSLARKFIALAWQSAKAAGELSKEFLADLVERAVQTRTELVLQSVEGPIRHDRLQLAALGRIALDVFLEEVQAGSQRGAVWRLIDLKGRALEWAVTALVEESVGGVEPGDLGEYNYAWSESNRDIGSGLGWLAALLKALLDTTAVPELLTWLGTWITRVAAFQDKDGTIGTIVSEWLAKADVVPPASGPLLDFAMDSILGRRMKLSVQLKLARGLLKAGYRTEDCLRMLDKNPSAAGNYRHWGMTEAAVICGETLPDP